MRAERIEADGLRGFMDKLDRLNVKDRLGPSGQPGKLRVGGVEFSLDANTRVKGASAQELQPGRLVQIEARQKEGRVVIERIEIRDEGGARDHEASTGDTAKAKRNSAREAGATAPAQETEAREEREAVRKSEADGHAASDRTDSHEKAAEKREREEKAEKPENDKAEKSEKAEKLERAEKAEKQERSEKPEKVEKPEKLEKVEKPEKPEKIERPEKPEIDD